MQINRKGQMLFLPATVRESGGFVHENTQREFWFSAGALVAKGSTTRTS